MSPAPRTPTVKTRGGRAMSNQSLTIRDNRTGATYEVPIADGAIRAMDLRQIKTSAEDFGLLAYDPAYLNARGLPYVYPDNRLGYCGNFLQMMFKVGEGYRVNPVLERALDVLFILHADHEQNCSANAMRAVGSSGVDPYSAAAGAVAA